MSQQRQVSMVYKQFRETFSHTDNPHDIMKFGKRKLSQTLKYSEVKEYIDQRSCVCYIFYFMFLYCFVCISFYMVIF